MRLFIAISFLLLLPINSHALLSLFLSPPPTVSVFNYLVVPGDIVKPSNSNSSLTIGNLLQRQSLSSPVSVSLPVTLYNYELLVNGALGGIYTHATSDTFSYLEFDLMSYDTVTGVSVWQPFTVKFSVTTLSNDLVTKSLTSLNDFSSHLGPSVPDSTTTINMLTKLDGDLALLNAKVAKMDPQVITQTVSFLLGSFTALAFVMAANARF